MLVRSGNLFVKRAGCDDHRPSEPISLQNEIVWSATFTYDDPDLPRRLEMLPKYTVRFYPNLTAITWPGHE